VLSVTLRRAALRCDTYNLLSAGNIIPLYFNGFPMTLERLYTYVPLDRLYVVALSTSNAAISWLWIMGSGDTYTAERHGAITCTGAGDMLPPPVSQVRRCSSRTYSRF